MSKRSQSPTLETCEQRTLLASSAFIQGVVTLSGTSTPLAGASILLHKLDTPSIPDETTTTDTSGVYQFLNLPSGKYQITETPPAGYENDGSQANSPLTPILNQTKSTIEVQLSDPNQLQLSYVSRNGEEISTTLGGSTDNSHVGQMNITVTEPDINYTTSLFPSVCVDYYRLVGLGEKKLPYQLESLSAGLANDSSVKNPQNAGEIAYLYNHYASTWSTNPSDYVPAAEAAGFQLAIWELEYETSGTYDVRNGSFFADNLNTNSPEYIDAQNFLTEAQGKSELAAYLNGLPSSTNSTGTQGFIAPDSLDFTNGPIATVNTVIFDAATNSPPPSGSDALGATVYDTATVTGPSSGPTPTGTVTYNFYDTATPVYGTTTPVSTQTVTLTSSGTVPNSATTAALAAGAYSYIAVYSGDSNYDPVVGAVEPLNINQADSSVTTNILDSGGGAVTGDLGETVYDTATVTASPFTPTGTVTYNFYNTATPVYGTTTPVSTQSVTLTSSGTVPNSNTTAALGAGSYSYIAVYSGDSNYKTDVGAVEPLTINQASSSVTTNILDSGGGPVTGGLGETVYDTATVTASPFTPTGTVTYNFYNTATPVYGTTTSLSTQTVTLTSSGTVPNSNVTAALGAGSYSYIAIYSGDSNYKTDFGAIEPLTINQEPSSVTTTIVDSTGVPVTGVEGEQVYDTAVVTATPFTPTGTVTYNFYDTDNPVYGTTAPISTQTVTLTSAGAVPNSATTAPLAVGSYSYIAVYSGDGNYKGDVGSPEPLIIISGGPGVSTSIDGLVFCDCNNDGIQEPGEPGISGVTITLTGVDSSGNPVDLPTTTNSQGAYSFESLKPGTYTVTESAPSGYFEGKTTAGDSGGTVNGVVISGISLAAGHESSGYNFANIAPSSISGVVYYDVNRNGVMDSSDFGIAHVNVILDGTNDLGQSVHLTTATDNNGEYSFSDLRPGTYDLIRQQPTIFVVGTNTVGSLGGTVGKNSFTDIQTPGCATAVDYLFGEEQRPNCNLYNLALHIGNVFYHFERTYQNDPAVIAKHYPDLLSDLASGTVPWGKAPFPKAPVASYWVPTLGTKPIKIFPVHGKLKRYPSSATTPAHTANSQPAHVSRTPAKVHNVHTPPIRSTAVLKRSR